MPGFLLVIGILGGLFMALFGIPYLAVVGVPEWVRLPRSKKKRRQQLLEYIEWKRAKDMKRYPTLYPTETDWNEQHLAHAVRLYERYPKEQYREMLDDKGDTELMQWVLKNDSSVRQSRIQQLEKELGFKSE